MRWQQPDPGALRMAKTRTSAAQRTHGSIPAVRLADAESVEAKALADLTALGIPCDDASRVLKETGFDVTEALLAYLVSLPIRKFVLALCRCYTKSQDDPADDLFQEVMTKAITRIRDLKPPTKNFNGWLSYVTYTMSVDIRRRRLGRQSLSLDALRHAADPSQTTGFEPIDPNPGPDQTAQYNELSTWLRNVADEKVAEAIFLAADGYTHNIAACMATVPPRTLRRRRTKLQAALAPVYLT
jgi:RNA polymerase sigma factor (sigma-70 family)